jgi:hypothetical protein
MKADDEIFENAISVRDLLARWGRCCQPNQLVHQVSDWCSGVAIKMGRRQGATKEHI